jgi:hypothetical protein
MFVAGIAGIRASSPGGPPHEHHRRTHPPRRRPVHHRHGRPEIYTSVDLGKRPGTDATVRLRLVSSFRDKRFIGSIGWQVVTPNGATSYSWIYPKDVGLTELPAKRFSERHLAYQFHAANCELRTMLAAEQEHLLADVFGDLFDLGYNELEKRQQRGELSA